jgi:hypothetical protein
MCVCVYVCVYAACLLQAAARYCPYGMRYTLHATRCAMRYTLYAEALDVVASSILSHSWHLATHVHTYTHIHTHTHTHTPRHSSSFLSRCTHAHTSGVLTGATGAESAPPPRRAATASATWASQEKTAANVRHTPSAFTNTHIASHRITLSRITSNPYPSSTPTPSAPTPSAHPTPYTLHPTPSAHRPLPSRIRPSRPVRQNKPPHRARRNRPHGGCNGRQICIRVRRF